MGPKCFKEGTLVKIKEGDKKIEDIEIGDEVLSYDEETGRQEYKKVVQLFRNETDRWYEVDIDGQEPIKCTAGHPFYILNAGNNTPIVRFEGCDENDKFGQWVAAKDLQIGYKCLLSNGETAIIKKVSYEDLDTPETTYNLEVADAHTYFVGKQGILVHNDCAPKSPKKLKESYLERYGVDAHAFKKSVLGQKAPIARYDIYVDTVDDLLWLGTKEKGNTQWVETYTSLTDLLLGG